MREIFMYGSVRGVARKGHSYRDRLKDEAGRLSPERYSQKLCMAA